MASLYLKNIVKKFNEDDRDVEWVINDRIMFNKLFDLVNKDCFDEINKLLEINSNNFLETNNYVIN